MCKHRPEVLGPHGEDDFVGRKYSAFADESHIGEARVAKSSGKVLTESPDEKNNNQNFILILVIVKVMSLN